MDGSTKKEEELFEAARRLSDPVERQAFLEATCSGDPLLRRQVEGLLEGLGRADGFFAQGVAALNRSSVVLRAIEKPGDRIGRYRLLEPIGEGGCAVVYMAEQEEPV